MLLNHVACRTLTLLQEEVNKQLNPFKHMAPRNPRYPSGRGQPGEWAGKRSLIRVWHENVGVSAFRAKRGRAVLTIPSQYFHSWKSNLVPKANLSSSHTMTGYINHFYCFECIKTMKTNTIHCLVWFKLLEEKKDRHRRYFSRYFFPL